MPASLLPQMSTMLATPTFVPAPPDGAVNQWTLVLGFFMPLLVSMLNQSHWATRVKTLVALGACVLASTIQLDLQHQLSLANGFMSALAVWSMALITFSHFWKPLGVAGALEKATDVPKPDVLSAPVFDASASPTLVPNLDLADNEAVNNDPAAK